MEIDAGKIAVVTGAGSGIGLAMANAFASAGCHVVLADVQVDALESAAAEVAAHGVETLSVRTDVSDAAQVAGVGPGHARAFRWCPHRLQQRGREQRP